MDRRSYLYMISVTLVLKFGGVHLTDDIIKYVTMKTETIRLSCPTKHVIFNPQLLGGTFKADGINCTGISPSIKTQVDTCHFRKSCEIRIRKADTVLCNGTEIQIAYLKITQPYCIPKDIILNVGTNRTIRYTRPHGIIRSHTNYPQLARNVPKRSTIRVPIPKSHTLFLTYHAGRGRRLRHVTLFKREGGNLTKIRLRYNKVGRFKFVGQGVKELVVKTRYRRGCKSHGFVLPFAVYSFKALKHLQTWPKEARPIMRDIGWIFEVKAVIEQCTVKSKGQISLTCTDDKIIYAPALAESGYTRAEPKCIWGHYPCGGWSPEVLVQKNGCYWQNACNITWSGASPILASRRPSCIGYQASTIGFSGHRCINKNAVYDLCTSNCTTEIDANWGIIRSHPTYPWYFDPEISECKRIIKIGGKRVLHLMVQDINVDPDGRDRISIIHALDENRRVLMDSKSTVEGAEVEVQGGTLIIKFTPYKDSKSGRGFILVFRRFSVKKESQKKRTGNHVNFKSDIVQDEGYRGRIRLSNRRLCSGRKRYRQKGKACAPRVWTDYFTRLE